MLEGAHIFEASEMKQHGYYKDLLTYLIRELSRFNFKKTIWLKVYIYLSYASNAKPNAKPPSCEKIMVIFLINLLTFLWWILPTVPKLNVMFYMNSSSLPPFSENEMNKPQTCTLIHFSEG